MLLWVVMAALTGLAVFALLRPLTFARETAGQANANNDVAFYESQMAEIERDRKRGLIDEKQAEAAVTEAARRLLRSQRLDPVSDLAQADAVRIRRRKTASLVALLGVPLVALPFYLWLGQPNLPDHPLAARQNTNPANVNVAEAVARIEAHLAKNPQDGQGYEVLAPVYMRMGRFSDAVVAYRAALRLNGASAKRHADLGEAITLSENGIVTPEAGEAFAQAYQLDPQAPRVRFYRALALEQDGKRDAALDAYRALMADTPADAPWRETLEGKIAILSGLPENGEAIANAPPPERLAAIRGMVEGLAERLEAQGGTADEWARLVRSFVVLGDMQRAKATLIKAKSDLASKQVDSAPLEAVAKELNVTP